MNSRKWIAVIGCAALIMIAGTACGSGQEEAAAETAIAETESLESSETESAESETESIIEDTTIDEAEAKKMLKEYSDQIAEADIEDYNEDLVYVFMTNYNEGKSADESFAQALQHVKDLKAFDEETKAQQQAQYDAEAREAEANKQAEAQTKQSNTTETAQQEPASVPIPKQEEQLIQQTEQAQPTPQQTTPSESGTKYVPEGQVGQHSDGSYTNIYGETTHVGDKVTTPDGSQTMVDLGTWDF